MYKILILTFVSVFNLTFAQNTVTEVIYKRDFNLKTLPKNITEKYSKTQQQMIMKKHANHSLLKYTMLYDGHESLFFLSDSLVGLLHDVNDNSFIKLIKREKKKKYYKNLNEQKVFQQTIIGGEKLFITGKFNQIKWQLLNKKKKIGNYLCYKAILTEGNILLGYGKDMVIEAWYAPELPVPFGPKNFEGLPGLILELKLGRNTYYASAIRFNTNKKITPLTEGKQISQEEYSLFLQELMEKILNKN